MFCRRCRRPTNHRCWHCKKPYCYECIRVTGRHCELRYGFDCDDHFVPIGVQIGA